MLPRSNGGVWMDGEEDEAISWPPRSHNDNAASLTSFKSMLDADCFINNAINAPNPFHHPEFSTLLFNPLDSSSSCSPSHPFHLDPSHASVPPKSMLPSLFTSNFDNAGVDLSFDQTYFPALDAPLLMGFNGFNPQFQFSDDNAAIGGGASNAFDFESFDRSKLLRPLEVQPSVGAQPTLFQKRAALRQSSRLQNLGAMSSKSDEGLTSVDDTGGWRRGGRGGRNLRMKWRI